MSEPGYNVFGDEDQDDESSSEDDELRSEWKIATRILLNILPLIGIVFAVLFACLKERRARRAAAAHASVAAAPSSNRDNEVSKEDRARQIKEYLYQTTAMKCKCQTQKVSCDEKLSAMETGLEQSETRTRATADESREIKTGSGVPAQEINRDDGDNDNDDVQECPICFEAFEVGDSVSWSLHSSCNHAFHRECIELWLLKSVDCPMCRKQLLGAPPKPDEKQTQQQPSSSSNVDKTRPPCKVTPSESGTTSSFCVSHGIIETTEDCSSWSFQTATTELSEDPEC